MGTPIPPPPPIGDNCIHCDSVLWTPGATPRWVYCTFSDIIACVRANFPAPNYTFVLEQDEDNPCYWWYEDSKYRVRWTLTAINSYLTCDETVSPFYYCFADTAGAPCQINFVNENISCAPLMNAGRLGTGVVFIP